MAVAEAAVARGVAVDDIAGLGVLRQLRRLGEELAEDDLDLVASLRQRVGDEFHALEAERES